MKKEGEAVLGYVRIDKGELKVKEYELYKGLYCSLCKAMGKHFGILSRLTLSYDITFLVLIRMCFSSFHPEFRNGVCPFNVTKRCNYCKNGDEQFRYAAAVSMMMFYYKIKDNILDGGFFKRILMYLILPYAYLKNRKAKKLYPEIEEMIGKAMENQRKTEKSNTSSSDEAAHESADSLGKIIAYGFEDEDMSIYRFGYAIGKWVYLCDAADDMKKDLKSGSFNVLVNMFGITREEDITDEVREKTKELLNMSAACSCEAFDEIPDKTLASIAENIIYDGTEKVMNNIMKGKKVNERSL